MKKLFKTRGTTWKYFRAHIYSSYKKHVIVSTLKDRQLFEDIDRKHRYLVCEFKTAVLSRGFPCSSTPKATLVVVCT